MLCFVVLCGSSVLSDCGSVAAFSLTVVFVCPSVSMCVFLLHCLSCDICVLVLIQLLTAKLSCLFLYDCAVNEIGAEGALAIAENLRQLQNLNIGC